MRQLPQSALTAAALLALLILSGCGVRRGTPQNLVLVVFDTLRADRMSLYGHSRSTTPFLDSIDHQLVVFSAFKAVAPWTLPTHATIFTGAPPAEHRAQWGSMKLEDEAETLAEILAAEGFCTAGFSANPLVKPGNGLAQGFETWEHVGGPWTERTNDILSKVPAVLQQAKDEGCRLFLFLNLMDTHIPYNTAQFGEEFGATGPGPIKNAAIKWAVNGGTRELTPDEWQAHHNAYDASVRASDKAAERLMGLLGDGGVLHDTMLVLTSDHGEGLGQHPEVGHSISVWEEQLAVPLAVRFPDLHRGGERESRLRSQLNLAPSILDWLQVSRPSGLESAVNLLADAELDVFADYRSYFSEGNRRTNVKVASNHPALAERIRHQHVSYCQNFKLVTSEDGRRSAFDLTADPNEQTDVAASTPDTSLRRCISAYQDLAQAGLLTPFDAEDRASEDEPDLDALRSLGYVQ